MQHMGGWREWSALRRVSAYAQRNTFSNTNIREKRCLTVPGGPMWFGTVILLWHLWSLPPNPNFKQTLLTCSMFPGRSCKAKNRETDSEWASAKAWWWRKGRERSNGEEEKRLSEWKSGLESRPKWGAVRHRRTMETSEGLAGDLVTAIKNSVSLGQNN